MTPPPFDPELAPVVETLRALRPPLASLADIPGRRELNAAEHRTVEELAAAYPAHKVAEEYAGDVPLLVMSPAESAGVLYYVHGGGTIVGSHLGSDVPNLLAWAGELNLTVVSPGYRLAPEHPYPAPVEDCYAGLLWTVERFAGPVVVGGVSAGGGLAAATTLLARDRGGPRLAGQLLVCPMLDDRNDTPSAVDLDGRGLWDRAANDVGWTAYLGEHREDVPAYAAPARAGDLSGLPPAFLDVGTAETFRDEVVAYASRIWQAGGEAELHVWPGGFHGFDSLAPEARLSRAARAARLTWLRRLLGQ
ncbi:alpha/beta hydrolase [Amycolatopsis stemonae]